MSDYYALAPEIILCVSALLILLVDLFIGAARKMILGWLSIMALTGSLLALNLVRVEKTYLWKGMFVADDYSYFFRELFLIAAFLVILISMTFMKNRTRYMGEYYIILLFATLGMMMMAGAADFIAIFVALELMALSFYVLTAFQKDKAGSNEAGVKYFILGAISTSIMIFGMSLVFGLTGTTELAKLSTTVGEAARSNAGMLAVALLFIVAGLGFKVAAVPFHMWAPDVYEGAPTPITAYLSVGSKAAAFAVLMRLFVWAFAPINLSWMIPIAILSILTMFVGNLIAIPQRGLKRFIAYSSISQAGFALMGMSMASRLGVQSVLFYLLAYVFSNIGVFTIIIAISQRDDDDSFEALAGLGRRSPFLGLAMTVFILSLAGIPLLAGFISKFFVFAAVVEGNGIWMAILGLINSTIALYYYLNVLREVYITEPSDSSPIETSPSLYAGIQICLMCVLLMGLWPAPFLDFALNAAKALF